MKAKLKVIDSWEFEDIQLSRTSFKYSPTGGKEMVIRGEKRNSIFYLSFREKTRWNTMDKGQKRPLFPTQKPKNNRIFGRNLYFYPAIKEYCCFVVLVIHYGYYKLRKVNGYLFQLKSGRSEEYL